MDEGFIVQIIALLAWLAALVLQMLVLYAAGADEQWVTAGLLQCAEHRDVEGTGDVCLSDDLCSSMLRCCVRKPQAQPCLSVEELISFL